ncbi:response regulator [Aeoliella sp.]|uniref:response regulator n=1 Tax=Aeoliella sp. TaxID=2795800 RepID=UPI003CCB7E55
MTIASRRALIVDADATWRDRLCAALRKEQFACEVAADGQQAIQLLAARPYDLLVTEMALPKVHGHALIIHTLSRSPTPRVVVVSALTDHRLVRDVFTRGVDDYLHKSTPFELLITKLLSLFDVDQWRAGQPIVTDNPVFESREAVLAKIEKRLLAVSECFADRLAPLFEEEFHVTETPAGVMDFVDRLRIDERAAGTAELHEAANTRNAKRVDVRTTGIVIQVNEQMLAIDSPVQVVLLDVSMTGVRLMHTRALPATDLVLSWQAESMPFQSFRLPISVTRCRPIGRFYDIGGMFDIPVEVNSLE